MKHYDCRRWLALVVAGTLIAGFAVAGDDSDSGKPDPKMEEMMKKVEA